MTEQNSKPKWTPGPWEACIDDTGGQWSGWPIAISPLDDEEKTIVRPGGFYPYKWDAATSQREAVANAHLIVAAPDLYEALEAAQKVSNLTSEVEHSPQGRRARAMKELMDICKQMDAALAKARGELE